MSIIKLPSEGIFAERIGTSAHLALHDGIEPTIGSGLDSDYLGISFTFFSAFQRKHADGIIPSDFRQSCRTMLFLRSVYLSCLVQMLFLRIVLARVESNCGWTLPGEAYYVLCNGVL